MAARVRLFHRSSTPTSSALSGSLHRSLRHRYRRRAIAFSVGGLLPALLALSTLGAQIYWISLAVELRRLIATAPTAPSPARAVATRLNDGVELLLSESHPCQPISFVNSLRRSAEAAADHRRLIWLSVRLRGPLEP